MTTDVDPQGALRAVTQQHDASARAAAVPTVGRIVHYRLSAVDLARPTLPPDQRGNSQAGQLVPAIVTNVFGVGSLALALNLHVLLDGPGTFWATSRLQGAGDGQWDWPR
jgi:hypothetical protein